AVSNFTFTATVSNTALATVSVTATNNGSLSNAVYTLSITPGTNQNGTTPIQLIASEAGLFTTNTLLLTIQPVNQAPTFTLATNFLVAAEESGLVTNAGFALNMYAGATNQASQTWTFTALTVTGNATNAAFTNLPAIGTNGTLSFKPVAHSYGTNLVTVIMKTTGATNNGGINTATNTFTLAVLPVSHAPVINLFTNVVVLENAAATNTTVNVWDYDLAVSNFTFTATVSNTTLATVSVTATNNGSLSNAVYTLTITPGTNQNGTTPIQLISSEAGLFTTNSLTLTVKPVNQTPSFTFSTNRLVVAENAGVVTNGFFVTNIYVGATNQSGQTWLFAVSCPTNNATNVTFAQFPAISTNGTLVFKTANYAFGTNQVTVSMTTSGSITNGGVNSCTNTFDLAVVQGQYPPAITGLTNKNMLENAITNLTMPFTVFDPLTTNFNITCTSANTNLLTVSVTGLGTNHTLVFAPVTNAFGTNTVTVTVDDGTLTNSATLTAGIAWVNQAPSFNLAIQSYIVDKYDVAVSLANAVTNIQAGPTNESGQTVTFVVTNSNSSLFLNQPTVSSLGTLIFTPGKVAGIVTVGIRAVDNGGALNGGVSNSASQTLTITIPPNPFNYLAGKFTGLFYDTNDISINSAGYFDLLMANDGTFTGFINNLGSSNGFSGQFSISNATMSVTSGNYVLNFTANTSANWTETVNGTVSN
ncbi:hypothetical protein, partial [Silvimonas sp.]|uniref:beta strand repeat-containing protein n=1 Tax=Silvimonas sp. TaxID=2650811 RepID=UPI002849AF3D